MDSAASARFVFGASAVLLGVSSLLWRDPDTWQTLSRLWSFPLGLQLGTGLMALEMAGGVVIQYPKTVRAGALLLAFTYSLFSLACVPDIVAAPGVYAHYGSFFEQFSALSGSVSLLAATEGNALTAKRAGRFARVGIGLCTVSFALSQAIYLHSTATLVPKWIPPGQDFWAVATTIAFSLAAAAILAHRHARLALRLAALMVALFGFLVWAPRLIAQPKAHLNWSEFGLTFLIAGALWLVSECPLGFQMRG